MTGTRIKSKTYIDYAKEAFGKGEISKSQFEEAVTRSHSPYPELIYHSTKFKRK